MLAMLEIKRLLSGAVLAALAASGCDPRGYENDPGAQTKAAAPSAPALPASAGGSAASGTQPGPGKHHVVLELAGAIAELPGTWDFNPTGKTLRETLARIDRVARDPDTRSLIVRISPVATSMATAEEVRGALLAAHALGKPVHCHLETGGNTEYLIATGCDDIALAPAGDIFLSGPHAEAMFVKGLLDKLGVVADFEHQGKYKGAADSLQRDTMSEAQREAIDALLDGATKRLTESVAVARKLEPKTVRALFDQAPFAADAAKAAKLVDKLVPFERFRDDIAKGAFVLASASEPKPEPPNIFELFSGKAPEGPKGKRLALVYLVGGIVHGKSGGGLMPSQEVASRDLVSQLHKLAADDDVEAVVLRIDSPGGSALASDIIWQAVRELAAKKPVIASMGAVAASGGYYIASGAHKIYAQPDTITGSIGVIGGKLVLGGLYDKLGVKKEILTRGTRAAMFSEARPFTPDERVAVTQMMKDVYGQFLDRVGAGRKLSRGQVEPFAQGRVWSGADALSHKLVDELGGLSAAIADARKRGKLASDAPIQILPEPPSLTGLIQRWSGGGGGDEVRATLATALLGELGAPPQAALDLVHALTMLRHDHVQAVMPFTLSLN